MTAASTSRNEHPELRATPHDQAPLWAATEPTLPQPEEVPPRVPVTSGRFARRFADYRNFGEHGLTEGGRNVLDLMFQCAPAGVTKEALVQFARAVELVAVDTATLSRASGNPAWVPTDEGDLITIGPVPGILGLVVPDLGNRRADGHLGIQGAGDNFRFVPPVLAEHDDPTGLRAQVFSDELHFQELLGHQDHLLGFTGERIADIRDRYDAESMAAQGIQKSLMVTPTRAQVDDSDRSSVVPSTIDGARRSAVGRFVLRRGAGVDPRWLSLSHFDGEDGYAFRDADAGTVRDARRRLARALDDLLGPGPGAESADVDAWAAGLTPRQQVVLRTLTAPMHFVVGLDRSRPVSENGMTKAVDAYMASLHVEKKAQREWEEKGIESRTGRRIVEFADKENALPNLPPRWSEQVVLHPTETRWTAGGLTSTADPAVARHHVTDPDLLSDGDGNAVGPVPLTIDRDLPAAVDSATERRLCKLDLLLATAAVTVCRGTPIFRAVGRIVSDKHKNSPRLRGRLFASVSLPLLGLPVHGSRPERVHAAISRTPTHSAVYKLDEATDPLGFGVQWPDLIGVDWLEVAQRAEQEAKAIAADPNAQDDTLGPAQVLLTLAAALAMAVSPRGLEADDAHQMTLSGMGGQRGSNTAEPFPVMALLARRTDGRRQLLEIVASLVGDQGPLLPRSVRHDPASVDTDRHGNRLRGPTVTEADLRGPTWDHDAGNSEQPRMTATQAVEALFSKVATALTAYQDQVETVTDPDNFELVDEELDDGDGYDRCRARAFLDLGVEIGVAETIMTACDRLSRLALEGQLLRRRAEGR